METVCTGFPENSHHLPHAAPFWCYRESLYVFDGMILYEDHMVVPPSLCKQVLKGLHAAHQGVSTMEMRAREIVFWPGMTEDIHKARAACVDCIRNAPSQASLPSTPATPPSMPFEQIFADPASTDILSASMPTSSQPGLEGTDPVAHPQLAQPKPQVELVMRKAPEDKTALRVFPTTGTRQPKPNPMPMLRDFPATGPSQP
jgi:hypothetical protein